jgi:hypothetical protein
MWLPNSPQTEDHGERARQLRLKSWFLLKTGDFTERDLHELSSIGNYPTN